MHQPVLTTVLAVLVAAGVSAQSPATPAFEVASVKPSAGTSGGSSSNDSPGGFNATNLSLRRLIAIAHRINLATDRERIVGPSWIDEARFDINARTPAGSRPDQIPDMLRTLLVQRFALATHVETREEPVFALVKARADGRLGPQLTPSTLDCSKPGAFSSGSSGAPSAAATTTSAPLQCGLISNVDANGAVLRGGARSMADLARNLTGRVNRTVIDRTGLTGPYDFVLRFTPDNFQNTAANAGPSLDSTQIFTAIQEQLGLRLEPQRGPAEFLIVDKVERPSPD